MLAVSRRSSRHRAARSNELGEDYLGSTDWIDGLEHDLVVNHQEYERLLKQHEAIWKPNLAEYERLWQKQQDERQRQWEACLATDDAAMASRLTLRFGNLLHTQVDREQRDLEIRIEADRRAKKREAAREGWRKRKLAGGASSTGKTSKKRKTEGSDDESIGGKSSFGREGSAKTKKASSNSLGKVTAVVPLETAASLPTVEEKIDADELHQAIWLSIARSHVPRAHKQLQQLITARALFCRRLSGIVARDARRIHHRIRPVKEAQMKSKRIMRDVLMYWKGSEKREREGKKAAQKKEADRIRQEEDMREAKRQARKLNFLLEQTELYGHFIGSKLNTREIEESETENASVVEKADTAKNERNAAPIAMDTDGERKAVDFYDEDESNLHEQARLNAAEAVRKARERAQDFDRIAKFGQNGTAATPTSQTTTPTAAPTDAMALDTLNFQEPTAGTSAENTELAQPKMLTCTLKHYQIKGLSWLANLYEQGINGILADEMGLGKTVQSISLLAYLAETHDIWGPFLVIAPASTLHNWQQEISRFVPQFTALPYWGNVKDRAVLRKFWNKKIARYDKNAPFHVLITSYQLVVADEKYFQKVKWQYMVLDEAQAIKSSTSARWKTLLNFNCRNRLLLTGTPIQNSMQELWALLHFIMPSLFDSHNEFSDWFAKDIENSATGSHAAAQASMNVHQLQRLHMILKPFMLRRIKKNVQNELGDKIEIDVKCDLTPRQRFMYQALKENVSLADLVARAASLSPDEATVKRLMNLIMQFRKVCNHPELFERADVKAPFAFCNFNGTGSMIKEPAVLYVPYASEGIMQLSIPRLLVEEDVVHLADTRYVDRLCDIWSESSIVYSMTSTFSFAHVSRQSPAELRQHARGDLSSLVNLMLTPESPGHSNSKFMCRSPKQRLIDSSLTNVTSAYHDQLYLPKGDYQVYIPKAVGAPAELLASSPRFLLSYQSERFPITLRTLFYGLDKSLESSHATVSTFRSRFTAVPVNGLMSTLSSHCAPAAPMRVPQLHKLILDSGKLAKLDKLLPELKADGHRVLIYFQMTRMIDLMEEYLSFRQYKYLRLDGSTTISDRRDMVTDWQTKPEIFIFLLSTRAGGLGINLTAADTVIFYDVDWNPSNDSQACDRAHRIGQTRQVTVYRLITAGTIDERILQLARSKKMVQDAVVGSSTQDANADTSTKPNEVVSLLLDDEEMQESVRRQQAHRDKIAEAKSLGGKRASASREENKRLRELAANASEASTPAPTWMTTQEDEDAFRFFTIANDVNGDEENGLKEFAAAEDDQSIRSRTKPRKLKAPTEGSVMNGTHEASADDFSQTTKELKRKRRSKAELDELDRLVSRRKSKAKTSIALSADATTVKPKTFDSDDIP